jgi:endonuclease/exonuclease/phosphatase family metal-dependent hydrolase
VRVLTWNLMHGRSVPGARRELFDEFAAALAGWEWDVALLQEVPPWWPARFGYEHRLVLTSRNSLLALRRAVAIRWPDLIKSNGGGCNAILVRGGSIAEHRVARLGWWPERRWVHGVRLGSGAPAASGVPAATGVPAASGVWVANTHTEASVDQGQAAANAVREWAGEGEAVLGGDFNVAPLELPGFVFAGGKGVDQVFVRGLEPGRTEVLEPGTTAVLERGRLSLEPGRLSLDRGRLSDHAPVRVTVGDLGVYS